MCEYVCPFLNGTEILNCIEICCNFILFAIKVFNRLCSYSSFKVLGIEIFYQRRIIKQLIVHSFSSNLVCFQMLLVSGIIKVLFLKCLCAEMLGIFPAK